METVKSGDEGQKVQIRSSFSTALLAGGIAGTTVDISLYPLDTLKTRLQAAGGFRAAGGFQGVYAGVGSAIIGSAPGAALFFVSYEHTKAQLRARRDSTGRWKDARDHMLAASVGEIAACAVRVPTEVIKQRAQAQVGRGSWEVLQHILQRRGRLGVTGIWLQLYRGWSITVMRELPFTAIQFPIWEALKGHHAETVTAIESALYGSLSGAIAAGVTTPLDVIKTRMMLAPEKESAVQLTRRIWADSGPRAFLAGIGPRIMWISAGGAIFLGSYQWASNLILG